MRSVGAVPSSVPKALSHLPAGNVVLRRSEIGQLTRLKSLPPATLHKVFAIPSQPLVALYLKMRHIQTTQGAMSFFSNFSKSESVCQDLGFFFSEGQILCPLREHLYFPQVAEFKPPVPKAQTVP